VVVAIGGWFLHGITNGFSSSNKILLLTKPALQNEACENSTSFYELKARKPW